REVHDELAGQPQDPARVGQERLARRRQRDPLSALPQELGSERPFERAQRLGNRRLRDPENARGAGVPARLHQGDEGAKVPELELGLHGSPFTIGWADTRNRRFGALKSPRRLHLAMIASNAALLVVDMQKGFDDWSWGRRCNPFMEGRIMELLRA